MQIFSPTLLVKVENDEQRYRVGNTIPHGTYLNGPSKYDFLFFCREKKGATKGVASFYYLILFYFYT